MDGEGEEGKMDAGELLYEGERPLRGRLWVKVEKTRMFSITMKGQRKSKNRGRGCLLAQLIEAGLGLIDVVKTDAVVRQFRRKNRPFIIL
jgi:hypothetical protein